jgi:hypothetical protein
MPPSKPEQELAAAEKRLDEARRRLADNRRRRRELTLQGNDLADAVSRELWLAGRDGRDADIASKRERITEIQAELSDLDRLEAGVEAAVVDAQNAVVRAYFVHAPHFEQALAQEAETLAEERAKLEAALANVADHEEDVRAGWRRIADSIPGAIEVTFADGKTIPTSKPSAPHGGISNHVAQDDWPSWYHDAVRASATMYGARQEVTA